MNNDKPDLICVYTCQKCGGEVYKGIVPEQSWIFDKKSDCCNFNLIETVANPKYNQFTWANEPVRVNAAVSLELE